MDSVLAVRQSDSAPTCEKPTIIKSSLEYLLHPLPPLNRYCLVHCRYSPSYQNSYSWNCLPQAARENTIIRTASNATNFETLS